MKKYLVTLNICQNHKKIAAIKDLRSATGMGLVDSKNFVETPFRPDHFVDSFGGNLIVNAEQLANLLILSRRDGADLCQTAGGFEYSQMKPTFSLDHVEEIVQKVLDVSTLIVMEA